MAQKRKINHVEEPSQTQRSNKTSKLNDVKKEDRKDIVPRRKSRRHEVVPQEEPSTAKSKSKRKRAISPEPESLVQEDQCMTPQAKRFKDILPPSPAETPSRKTAQLFDRLQLQSMPAMKSMTGYNTPPDTPEALRYGLVDGVFPTEIQDLLDCHTAVLQALSARLALNTSHIRINIDDFLREASGIWQKRQITLPELQRMLALQSDESFKIENFGKGGICLVKDEQNHGIDVINITKQHQEFQNILLQKWHAWLSDHTEAEAESFLKQLPSAIIWRSDSIDKASSLSAKGKQRLSDLRQSRPEAQTIFEQTSLKTAHQNTVDAKDRGASLLDRIIAKQSHIASLPAGPTKSELERKAALHRIEEIVRVMDVLSAGRARASFSMQSLVQQLQQSLRNPISKIEVERSVDLMAGEIMPTFVSIINSGNMVGVVITKAGKPSFADMKRRIADAC